MITSINILNSKDIIVIQYVGAIMY